MEDTSSILTSDCYTTYISNSYNSYNNSDNSDNNNNSDNSNSSDKDDECLYCKKHHDSKESTLKCRNKYYNNTYISYHKHFPAYQPVYNKHNINGNSSSNDSYSSMSCSLSYEEDFSCSLDSQYDSNNNYDSYSDYSSEEYSIKVI